MIKSALLIAIVFSLSGYAQTKVTDETKKKKQELLVEEYLDKGASRYNYDYQMVEWQMCLDEGLQKDSTVARLWQEKAMPYFKARKYEVGMEYVDKAVLYDRREYLPYRAFIKCIFSKQYKESISDFEQATKEFGNEYVMDHTFDFYKALCYLQLNQYEKADALLKNDIDVMLNKNGKEWVNTTTLFYYGIAKYEQRQYAEAIKIFDSTLVLYEHFSDAKYYKAICIARLQGSQDEIKELIKQSKEDAKQGYTIGEYNTVHETYPYQQKWNY